MRKESAHESYISELCKRLSSEDYDILGTHVTYPHGELDILARKNGQIVYFEVKSSEKGLDYGSEQVRRWRRYTPGLKEGYVYVGRTRRLQRVF